MLAPLQIEASRFTKIHLEGVQKGLPKAEFSMSTSVEVAQNAEDSRDWRLTLGIEFFPDDTNPDSPYKGEIEVVGFFRIAEGWPEEKMGQLVEVNGASMLYGSVRELVSTLSARSSHGEILLPSLSFANLPKEGDVPTITPPPKKGAKPQKKSKKIEKG